MRQHFFIFWIFWGLYILESQTKQKDERWRLISVEGLEYRTWQTCQDLEQVLSYFHYLFDVVPLVLLSTLAFFNHFLMVKVIQQPELLK